MFTWNLHGGPSQFTVVLPEYSSELILLPFIGQQG
jgi:hypothetical protein